MKKKRSEKTAVNKKIRRAAVLVIVIIAASVGAVTVIGGHRSRSSISPSISNKPAKKYVTVSVAGSNVQVDPQTGQIQPLTADEAKQLADGLKTILNKSTAGLAQVRHPDGTVSMDLQGRFQNVTVARRNADGTLTQSCVDNPEAAASFFGIDPQLLGAKQGVGATQQPIHRPTVKASAQ